MRKLVITANFHVDIADRVDPEKPPVRRNYTKGMVVDEADVPEGHAADGWMAKGLANEATDPA